MGKDTKKILSIRQKRDPLNPWSCPLLSHVIEQQINQHIEAQSQKSLSQFAEKLRKTIAFQNFNDQHDRGLHILDKTLALIIRNPLFDRLLDELLQSSCIENSQHKSDITTKISKKWHLVPWVLKDALNLGLKYPVGSPYRLFATGEKPFVILGGLVDVIPYVNISVYLNPFDEQHSLKAAKDYCSTFLEESMSKLARSTIPESMRFIFSTKNATFWKYVEWYDLHRFEGRSFRDIAYISRITDSQKRSQYAETLSPKKKHWHNKNVKGEDNVEQGVKLICMAIDRKPFKPPKKQTDTYNCPEHGNSCPTSCRYFIKWWMEFDANHPETKGLAPLSSDLGIDPDTRRLVHRGTKPRSD